MWQKPRIGFMKKNPGVPWLTPEANQFLDEYLKDDHAMLELGSGRSNLWFAKRVGPLTSVEHHVQWYENINELIQTSPFKHKISYFLRSLEHDNYGKIPYISEIEKIENESLDVVLIDGKLRDQCFLACLPKLKSNGIINVDDANRYFVSDSKSPYSKREINDLSENWKEINTISKNWSKRWTSNDIHDTLLIIKP